MEHKVIYITDAIEHKAHAHFFNAASLKAVKDYMLTPDLSMLCGFCNWETEKIITAEAFHFEIADRYNLLRDPKKGEVPGNIQRPWEGFYTEYDADARVIHITAISFSGTAALRLNPRLTRIFKEAFAPFFPNLYFEKRIHKHDYVTEFLFETIPKKPVAQQHPVSPPANVINP